MPNMCPRCGKPVSRAYSSGAQIAAGLVGALFYAAFGPLACKDCGKIPLREFPANVQTKVILTSVALCVGAVALIVLLVWLIGLD